MNREKPTFDESEIIKYINQTVKTNKVIEECHYTYDEITKEYFQKQYFMVPGHFVFKVAGVEDWDDKFTELSFLNDNSDLLIYDDDKIYHKQIQNIFKNKTTLSLKEYTGIPPSKLKKTNWHIGENGKIYYKIMMADPQNPIRVRQR